MSCPPLPPEILDYIVDSLCDDPEALRNSCLVAKSWVPRTRKHLFRNIKFTLRKNLESWKKTFPDPSNSPAYYTHVLSVKCPQVVTAADAGKGGWIQAFSRVVRLSLDNPDDPKVSLAPFYGFSPVLKSLRVSSTLPQISHIFNFARSFPLLEDLALIGYDILSDNGNDLHVPQPNMTLASPAFTGSLELMVLGGIGIAARRLLDLPSGLHFRKFALLWLREEDVRWTTELVARCSHTLECIGVMHHLPSDPISPICVDLSKAIKLRYVVFQPRSLSIDWITTALRTVTSKHKDLRRVSIYVHCDIPLGCDVRKTVGEKVLGQWSDLDYLLVQFWEARSIRPRVVCSTLRKRTQEMRDSLGCLLPEITKRGIIVPV